MRSVQSPAKALKGLSFEIADLIGIRERSEANGLRMVVRLDYGSDVEEYEEVHLPSMLGPVPSTVGSCGAGRAPGSGVRVVGKWPAVATAKSLAEAGHLSTAVVIADLR